MLSQFARYSTSTIAGATRRESKTCRPRDTLLQAIDLPQKDMQGRQRRHPMETEIL